MNSRNSRSLQVLVTFVVLATAFLLCGCQEQAGNENRLTELPGVVERISLSGEIHAGYGVYPPYSVEDPNTGDVSGFSVELIEHIAGELNCTVVWHRVNWNTMSADLKRGEYDVIADPIFQTIPRAPEFAFSEPYALFADGIAVVRKGEARFEEFGDLDREGVVINVGLNQASEALVRARFSKATIDAVSVPADNMQIFQGVLSGRADAAVADAPNAKRFVEEHPEQAKALWLQDPPAYMPAGFALRPSDERGAAFLTACLRYLRATGILADLAKKYDIPSKDPYQW